MTMTQKNLGNERIRRAYLNVFVKSANGVPMEEALRMADEAGVVIASNKRLSKALGSDELQVICEVFGCWSGTMTAYDRPEQKLGKIIEYTDSETGVRYVFPVPEEQQGKKNVILVAEHPNFSLVKDGNDRIVQATEVGVVERFPTSGGGWFLGDPKYDIPHGDKLDYVDRGSRWFWRIDKMVGLVTRGYRNNNYDSHSQYLILCSAPSLESGVAVEAASGGAQLSVREEHGKLIVEGTPEQIAAAARLLEQLKVK